MLPGGTKAAAPLHVAAPLPAGGAGALAAGGARRESARARLPDRLSDLLFILSRAANAAEGHEEPLWRPGSSS